MSMLRLRKILSPSFVLLVIVLGLYLYALSRPASSKVFDYLVASWRGYDPVYALMIGVLFGAAMFGIFLCHCECRKLDREKCDRGVTMQTIVETARDAVIIMDGDGRVSYWNPAAERIFGYTSDEVVGRSLHELLAPERYHEAFHAAFGNFQRSGQGAALGQSLEIEARRKDGTEIDVAMSISAMQCSGKWHAVGILRDISNRKRTEKALLEFKSAVEQSVDGIAMADLDGNIRFVNESWASMHGYSVNELVGQHLSIFHTEEQMEKEVKPFNEQLLKTGSQKHEIGHVRKDGTEFPTWMSNTVLTDAAQEPFALLAIARNITDYRRDEEIRKKNEAMLSCIFHSVVQAIFWKDRDSVFLGCNEVFAKSAGLSPDEIVGKTDFDLPWSREEAEAYRADDREVMESRRSKCHIVEPQHRCDGSVVWLETTKTPLLDSDGKIHGVLGVYEDITERKRMEDEIREAKEAAESATRLKSQFLANMSHEIRTPMTAILGFADVLSEDFQNCPSCTNFAPCQRRHVGQEAISTIRRNGEHLLALINDILDLSKIEAKKMQIELSRCSPTQLVADVVSSMNPLAAAKQLKLRTELVGPLPETIVTDPLRLRQVMVNIIGNAIKFTDQGEVRITARWIGEPAVPRLQIEVADTGIGMREEQVAKLFKPFVQVDGSPTRKFGGTGLGLCISKLLAEALGGDIEVHSVLGQGSTFVVTIGSGAIAEKTAVESIPEAAVSPQPVAASAPPERIAIHGRILLAEDGIDNQRLISFLLRKAGAEVITAENGQLAIEAVETAQETGELFDVILMDMQMPVLDGYEATRRLRAMNYTGPVIALTAHAMSQDRQACLDAGCSDYLTKPLEHRRMLETIAKHLPSKQTGEDATAGEVAASSYRASEE
jgi:PAS domain S-box-containing protein